MVRPVLGALLALIAIPALAQEPLRLFAAGSLRAVMTDIGAAFEAAAGVKVQGTYGASGLLKDRLEAGERADVFASANMQHPQALANVGRGAPAVLFTRNRLCALVAPSVRVSSADLLDRMLDPAVKLGISTPKADPSGDYAVELFGKAGHLRAGAEAALLQKARQLTGGPNSPPPPSGRSVYGMLVSTGEADLFLTYCTNALQARTEVPGLQIIQVPVELAVGADYGLTVLDGAAGRGGKFAEFILSFQGQSIFARHGFASIDR